MREVLFVMMLCALAMIVSAYIIYPYAETGNADAIVVFFLLTGSALCITLIAWKWGKEQDNG